MSTIAALHAAGIHVLADKPWVVNKSAVAPLTTVSTGTAGSALAMDIMTGHHDVIARLRKQIVTDAELFGGFRNGPEPALEFGSVHHLLKTVNGRPLQRPAWYYDVRVQGDGLVDIQSHMTDQAQWLLESDTPYDYARDVRLLRARRWNTQISLDLYQRSTGQPEFDARLEPNIIEGVLHYGCNGAIDYRLRGVSVRQTAEWRPVEPEHGGDLHHTVIRGTRTDVVVRQGPETGFQAEIHLRVNAATDAPSLHALIKARIRQWQEEFPGLAVRASDLGLQLMVPDSIHTPHEAHFAMVLETFLDYLDAGRWPRELSAAIGTRYTLLANAHQLARKDELH
jgi:predicted dehydrogenase